MAIFICEKCGRLDNTANGNNFWQANSNKVRIGDGRPARESFADPFFDTHVCCGECCEGVKYKDGSGQLRGNEFDTVSEKPYWEMKLLSQESVINYDYITKRDKKKNKKRKKRDRRGSKEKLKWL